MHVPIPTADPPTLNRTGIAPPSLVAVVDSRGLAWRRSYRCGGNPVRFTSGRVSFSSATRLTSASRAARRPAVFPRRARRLPTDHRPTPNCSVPSARGGFRTHERSGEPVDGGLRRRRPHGSHQKMIRRTGRGVRPSGLDGRGRQPALGRAPAGRWLRSASGRISSLSSSSGARSGASVRAVAAVGGSPSCQHVKHALRALRRAGTVVVQTMRSPRMPSSGAEA